MSGLAAVASSGLLPAHADSGMSFNQALVAVQTYSPKLEASEAAVTQRVLQDEALVGLGGPTVMLRATAARYEAHGDIDLSGINRELTIFGHQVGETLSPLVPGGLPAIDLPSLPDRLEWEHGDTFHKASVVAAWPIYTGGRVAAVQSFSQGRVEEAVSEQHVAQDELHHTLVERYFAAQLAERVAALHHQAERAIAQHDHAAKRMLDEGLIANAERLQASAAYENARRAREEADNNQQLATVALASLVHRAGNVRPSSPLFLHSQSLEPLSYFQVIARANHPGFETLNAKRHQAQALKSLNDARWQPNVALFASHELEFDNPDWMVGVNASWTLHSPIDRNKMIAASRAQLHQVEATERQAEMDINLLVERNWLAVENARSTYFAMRKNIQLAQEVVRLHQAGFREGINTAMDVMDAETKLAKVRTEQAKAAYDYVMALQALLTSAGIPEQFSIYMQQADIRL